VIVTEEKRDNGEKREYDDLEGKTFSSLAEIVLEVFCTSFGFSPSSKPNKLKFLLGYSFSF